jgi:glutamate-1-semialdehyde aminotransferase
MLDKSKGRYSRSNALLDRARKVIPLGSQTFSKSHLQFPQGAAPLFLTHGKGSRVWDADGNEYIDLIAGLLPILLGYRDPDVDAAIKAQLDRGITFSLATELEVNWPSAWLRSSRARKWCASARTAPMPPQAVCALRERRRGASA